MDEWVTTLPPRPQTNPRWLTESYQGMEKDIADELHSRLFWKAWDGKEETLEQESDFARANAEAASKALLQVGNLQGSLGRSLDLLLWRFSKNNLFRFLDGEFSSIKEFLEFRFYDESHEPRFEVTSSEYADLNTLLTEVLPMLEQSGKVDIEKLMCIPTKYTKVRRVMPRIRQAVQNAKLSIEPVEKNYEEAFEHAKSLEKTNGAQYAKAIKDLERVAGKLKKAEEEATTLMANSVYTILDFVGRDTVKIGDKEVRVTARNINSLLDGQLPPEIVAPPKIPGNQFFLPAETVFVIRTTNQVHAGLVERALSGIISEWKLEDGLAFVKTMKDLLLRKTL